MLSYMMRAIWYQWQYQNFTITRGELCWHNFLLCWIWICLLRGKVWGISCRHRRFGWGGEQFQVWLVLVYLLLLFLLGLVPNKPLSVAQWKPSVNHHNKVFWSEVHNKMSQMIHFDLPNFAIWVGVDICRLVDVIYKCWWCFYQDCAR